MGDPMTPDEFLAHYGVKGMRWGVRKAPSGSDIRAARRSVASNANAVADQHDKVKAQKRGSVERAQEKEKLSEMKVDFLKNPDRVTAARLTRGEKAVFIALAIPSGGLATAAGLATPTAIRKTIESRQASGYYDRKK